MDQILQWQIDRAISHIKGGIKILSEYWVKTGEVEDQNATPLIVPLRKLITVFLRLETQLCRLVQPIPHLIVALGDPPDLPSSLKP